MGSKSNIATDEIERYVIDETGEVLVDLRENGQPLDLTHRTFCFDFVARNTSGGGANALNIVVHLPNAEVLRPVPGRIGCWLSPDNKALLTEGTYKLWLSETTTGKKNPLVCYTFSWRIEPQTFDATKPLEPAVLVYDLLPPTGIPSVSQILQGPPGKDALIPLATLSGLSAVGAATPVISFIAAEGRAILKYGPDYYEFVLTPLTL